MTITLGGINTGPNLHGTIGTTQYDADISRQTFFGIRGEFYLLGQKKGRDLSCWILLHAYDTHSALQNGVDVLNGWQLESGTLNWSVGGDSKDWTNTIFLGFEADEEPWWDASGVHGWQVKGKLKFRQVFQ